MEDSEAWPIKPPARVRLEIRVYRKRKQDPDNAVASCKYLIDGLQKRGWLVDDSSEWLELSVSEEVDRANTRTEITWESC